MGLSYTSLNFFKEIAENSLELLGLLLELLLVLLLLLLHVFITEIKGALRNFFEKVQTHVAQAHLFPNPACTPAGQAGKSGHARVVLSDCILICTPVFDVKNVAFDVENDVFDVEHVVFDVENVILDVENRCTY